MASIVAARQGAPAIKLQIRGARSAANATQHSEHHHGHVAREILDDADAVDQEEDERYGKAWR
jgi:hypothetical protein